MFPFGRYQFNLLHKILCYVMLFAVYDPHSKLFYLQFTIKVPHSYRSVLTRAFWVRTFDETISLTFIDLNKALLDIYGQFARVQIGVCLWLLCMCLYLDRFEFIDRLVSGIYTHAIIGMIMIYELSLRKLSCVHSLFNICELWCGGK